MKIEKIAVNTVNDDGRVREDIDSYLLGQDDLLLRYIPTIAEEEENDSPFRVVISSKVSGVRPGRVVLTTNPQGVLNRNSDFTK